MQGLDIESRQCRRRTMSEVVTMPHIYEGLGGEGQGKGIMTLMAYPMPEGRPNTLRCRPMRVIHSAFANIMWLLAIGRLTPPSQVRPPNCVQCLSYYQAFRSKMGKHRDNFSQHDVRRVVGGGDIVDDNRIVGGIKNSTVFGSCVLVYSTGNRPMKMRFWYSSKPDEVMGDKKYFTTSARFQFACGNGWLTVLDPIDDLLMCHDVVFLSEDEADVEGYRVCWVFRWLRTPQDFFVDTSGLRRTKEMMEKYGDDIRVDDRYPERVRDILL